MDKIRVLIADDFHRMPWLVKPDETWKRRRAVMDYLKKARAAQALRVGASTQMGEAVIRWSLDSPLAYRSVFPPHP